MQTYVDPGNTCAEEASAEKKAQKRRGTGALSAPQSEQQGRGEDAKQTEVKWGECCDQDGTGRGRSERASQAVMMEPSQRPACSLSRSGLLEACEPGGYRRA